MITGAQIRAARAFLRWSAADLSRKSGVSHQAIHRAEQSDGIPSMLVNNLAVIRESLEIAGVEFIAERDGVSVRMKNGSPCAEGKALHECGDDYLRRSARGWPH